MTYQEYRVTFMSSNNEWKLPLNLAIGFHILVALSTILFPMVFKSKPEFVDIYSVNLVNMEEPAAPALLLLPLRPRRSLNRRRRRRPRLLKKPRLRSRFRRKRQSLLPPKSRQKWHHPRKWLHRHRRRPYR